MIIALDGPAGAGKTSTARAVADGLGYFYMDTGAMYRAITLAVLKENEQYGEVEAVQISDDARIDVQYIDQKMVVYLNGENVTDALRTPWINEHVSKVSSYKAIREKLVELQRSVARQMVHDGFGVVVDGRDIGTVVFPEAEVKFFIVASPEIRARRRYEELIQREMPADYDEILKNVNDRDAFDSGRDISPLRKAEDAMALDTTALSFDDQVSQVINTVLERQQQHNV